MTGLVRVELRRLRSRRVARFAALALLVGLVVVLGKVAHDSSRDTAAARAKAEAIVAQQQRYGEPGTDPAEEYAKARASCTQAVPPGTSVREACGPERYEDQFFVDPRFSYAEHADNSVLALSVVLALLALAVGASFVGAEWQAGTMAGLLAWEPRRLRVLGAKALALAVAVAGASIGFILLTVAAEWVIAATRGSTEGATAGLQQSVALTGLRGVGFATGVALLGAALATVLRNTAAVLGLAFAYFAAAEIGLRAAWHGAERWLLTTNIGAYLDDGLRLVTSRETTPGSYEEVRFDLSLPRAATFLGLLLAAVLAAATVLFRRRDVT